MDRAPTSAALHEFVEHYGCERNHRSLGNELVHGTPPVLATARLAVVSVSAGSSNHCAGAT